RTVELAQRAFGAGCQIDDRPLRARRVFLEELVARGTKAADLAGHRVRVRSTLRLAFDGDARSHVLPAWQFELEQPFGIALARFYIDCGEAFESGLSGSYFQGVLQLFVDE